MLHSDPVSAAELGIAPVKQLTPEWCWAASAEMILRTTAFPVSTRLEFTSAVSLALKANHALATAGPFLSWVLAGQPKRLQQSSNNNVLMDRQFDGIFSTKSSNSDIRDSFCTADYGINKFWCADFNGDQSARTAISTRLSL
jgi:hypothetical protein